VRLDLYDTSEKLLGSVTIEAGQVVTTSDAAAFIMDGWDSEYLNGRMLTPADGDEFLRAIAAHLRPPGVVPRLVEWV